MDQVFEDAIVVLLVGDIGVSCDGLLDEWEKNEKHSKMLKDISCKVNCLE